MTENKFQPGDIVMAFGCEGLVSETSFDFVWVDFGEATTHKERFIKDGKLCSWHKNPSLTLTGLKATALDTDEK